MGVPKQPRFRAHIGGKACEIRYSRRLKKNWGFTLIGNPYNEIVISTTCRDAGKEREIVIHEALHILFPHLDESIILQAAVDLDNLLSTLDL